MLRAFLCHSSSDKEAVRALYYRLRAEGIDPWLDEENLLPGQDWQQEIPKAVKKSDVVIVCLSRASVNKSGYVQKEIKYALDVADEQPEGTIFIIPLKLEECDIPERLRRWQWVNIFEGKGFERLMNALRLRAGSLGHSIEEPAREQVLHPAEDSPSEHQIFASEKEVVDFFLHGQAPQEDQGVPVWPDAKRRISRHRIKNKLVRSEASESVSNDSHIIVASDNAIEKDGEALALRLRKAGLSEELFYGARRSLNIAILVSGGTAPGTNAVIDAIVKQHWKYAEAQGQQDGLRIYGLMNGFKAFDDYHSSYHLLAPQPMNFDRELVSSDFATKGGSVLGTSRVAEFEHGAQAEQRLSVAVQMLRNELIDVLYVIGGDGSMKAAHRLWCTASNTEWGGPLSVIGIPQTIHNNILWVSQSLGSLTAAAAASEILQTMYTEIRSNPRIGVVHLPGDTNGFLVVQAVQSMPEGHCDAVLIPEVPFSLRGLARYLEEKTYQLGDINARALVVAAEGAIPIDAIEFLEHLDTKHSPLSFEEKAAARKFEERKCEGRISCGSNEKPLLSAGPKIITNGLRALLGQSKRAGREISVFSVEPRHILRTVPPNDSDVRVGWQLGTIAVDSAMAGYTDIMIGHWLGEYIGVPLELVAHGAKRVNTAETLWTSVLVKTGQPADLI